MKNVFVSALSITLVSMACTAEPVVVVSRASSVTALTADQISRIYLGKTRTFPDGNPATPLDMPERSHIRDEFYAAVVEKSPAQLKAYWVQLIFSGLGKPPRAVQSINDARDLMRKNPGVIVYLDREEVKADMKIVYPRH
jgi:hypothetical protein